MNRWTSVGLGRLIASGSTASETSILYSSSTPRGSPFSLLRNSCPDSPSSARSSRNSCASLRLMLSRTPLDSRSSFPPPSIMSVSSPGSSGVSRPSSVESSRRAGGETPPKLHRVARGHGVSLLLVEADRFVEHADRLGEAAGETQDLGEIQQRVRVKCDHVSLPREPGALERNRHGLVLPSRSGEHQRPRAPPQHLRGEIV